jgi:hypothetical protein
MNCKYLYYIFKYLCKMDYMKNTFIGTPTFNYNEVMHILESLSVPKA